MSENIPSYTLVVAKYNEDMNWLNFMEPSSIIIYDKGSTPIPDKIDEINIYKRLNLGRESETYLFHIINNYYNLPEYLIFVQGNPFDHMNDISSHNFQEKINNLLKSMNDTNVSCLPLFTNWYTEHHYKYQFIHSPKYFMFFFTDPLPPQSVFSIGAQYIVSKSQILSKPIEFYKKIHRMLLANGNCSSNYAHYEPHDFDPHKIDPWVLERLFGYIFQNTTPQSRMLQIDN